MEYEAEQQLNKGTVCMCVSPVFMQSKCMSTCMNDIVCLRERERERERDGVNFYIHSDMEIAKALSIQERQRSPSVSYEEIDDRDSPDSLTPLHSVNSWLNIPSEPQDATTWVDRSYPRSKRVMCC